MRMLDGTEVLYMAVTADKYELPFAVFYSVDEAAEWSGMKKSSVLCKICNDKKKKSRRGYKFVKVVIESHDGIVGCRDSG